MHCVAQCERDCDVIVNEEERIFISKLILESMQRHSTVVNFNNI